MTILSSATAHVVTTPVAWSADHFLCMNLTSEYYQTSLFYANLWLILHLIRLD